MKANAKPGCFVLCIAFLVLTLFPLASFVYAQHGTITYDSASNTITISDYPASNPCDFTALWRADQAGNWNVIQHQGNNQFVIGCRIVIANGAYLNDTNKQISMTSNVITANGQYFIGGQGTLTLGTAVNSALRTTSSGCSFYTPGAGYWYYWIWTGRANIYGCSFNADGWNQALVYADVLWNTIATGQGFAGFHTTAYCDFFNVLCLNTHFGIYFETLSSTGTYDKISLLGCKYGIRNWGAGDGATLSNVYARGCTYLFANENLNQPISQYLVNVDADNWTFSWVSEDGRYPSWNDSMINRQYTFDLVVTDPSGAYIRNAFVSLVDNRAVQTFFASTNNTGQIPTATVTLGFYNHTGGDEIYSLAPYTLSISAPGYHDYSLPVTFTEKTDWVITLQPYGREIQTNYTMSRFTFSPSSPKINESILFDGSLSNSSAFITSYFWDFGDGTTSSDLVTATHTYPNAGNYTVTLTVVSAAGTDTWSQIITVAEFQGDGFPWWLLVLALLILLLLLLLLLLRRRRHGVIVIKTRELPVRCRKCIGDGNCDNCDLTPC